ncbi:MAG TPA: diguanylate cyclase [Thermoanaerobaculia bacterium]
MATTDEQPGRRRSDFDEEPSSSSKVRILAVDDDRTYLEWLKIVLTRGGFEVALAHDGPSAIEHVRANEADILIIDLTMPRMDGIETVRLIQAEAAHFPGLYTILLTAQEGTETKLRALNSGLDDFLTKASAESEILAKLRSAARRLEMERKLHLANEELQTLALTDELTGIANRRALFRAAEQILGAGRVLSVVLFDLDRFKEINDTWGHLTGDRILAGVAATFKEHTRYADVVGRYGGDEFVLLLPDTELEEARQIAERVGTRIRELRWSVGDHEMMVSAACGVACGRGDLVDLLARCDEQMYRRKRRTVEMPLPLTEFPIR